MPDEHSLTLHQADRARTDFAAIADDLDFVKAQLARLPTRKELARTALLAINETCLSLHARIISKCTVRKRSRCEKSMPKVLQYYMDDSGTRHPDRKSGKRPQHGKDWFALGGILVNEEDETESRTLHSEFCRRWGITNPLHSVEIRGKNRNFHWLSQACCSTRNAFLEELYQMMRTAPVIGLACVIDRPGYNHRYLELYGRKPWLLCKTVFAVAVERAAKEALRRGRKLRVLPEKCNKVEDQTLKSYYNDLRSTGMPFSFDTSGKYQPLTPEQFGRALHEFKPKEKTSPMAQFADLYLWPIAMGGYRASVRPYARLMNDGKLIECTLARDTWDALATKYSCFDLVQREP
jgi:hypothetical protein